MVAWGRGAAKPPPPAPPPPLQRRRKCYAKALPLGPGMGALGVVASWPHPSRARPPSAQSSPTSTASPHWGGGPRAHCSKTLRGPALPHPNSKAPAVTRPMLNPSLPAGSTLNAAAGPTQTQRAMGRSGGGNTHSLQLQRHSPSTWPLRTLAPLLHSLVKILATMMWTMGGVGTRTMGTRMHSPTARQRGGRGGQRLVQTAALCPTLIPMRS